MPKKKKHRKQYAPICKCGQTAKLVDSKVIYRGVSYGWAWVCPYFPKCACYVGCHKGTKRPLGPVLVDRETRRARMAAHDIFDRRWKGQHKLRQQQYAWLAGQLGIPVQRCHIGMFDVETCRKVIAICNGTYKLEPKPEQVT